MSLQPLLDASPAVQVHAVCAMAALGLGAVQMARRKGTGAHRIIGWTWATLMAVVAGSSFFIHDMPVIGPFGPIHMLSLVVAVVLPMALIRARSGNIRAHAASMRGLFYGGLILAGLFTLWPGRIMHQVLFGSSLSLP